MPDFLELLKKRRSIRDPLLLEEIGLPEGHTIVAPVILGYPRMIPPVPVREEPQILTIVSA